MWGAPISLSARGVSVERALLSSIVNKDMILDAVILCGGKGDATKRGDHIKTQTHGGK